MTSPSPIVRLPLPAMTAVIAGLTVLALLLAVRLHWGIWRYAFFAIPAIVAVYYLTEYRKLPYEPYHFWPEKAKPTPAVAPSAPAPPPAVAPAAEEPFEDPVEEADRLAAEGPSNTPETEPTSAEPASTVSDP